MIDEISVIELIDYEYIQPTGVPFYLPYDWKQRCGIECVVNKSFTLLAHVPSCSVGTDRVQTEAYVMEYTMQLNFWQFVPWHWTVNLLKAGVLRWLGWNPVCVKYVRQDLSIQLGTIQ